MKTFVEVYNEAMQIFFIAKFFEVKRNMRTITNLTPTWKNKILFLFMVRRGKKSIP